MKRIVKLMVVFCFSNAMGAVTYAEGNAPAVDQAISAPGDTDQGVFVTLSRSSQKQLPTDVETIRPNDFQAYDPQNAGDVVSRATSVQVTSTGGLGSLQTASVRGASTAQTLVLLDGRPYTGNTLGAADLSEIPIEQIDRIEIVRGGVSSLYGPNAMGGVINVITKRASHTDVVDTSANYEVGSYGREAYRLNVGSHAGPLDFSFFGDKQWESGFRDNEDDRQHNVGGNAGISLGGAGKLTFDVSSYHANAGLPGELFTDIPTNQYNNVIEKQAATPMERQITDNNSIRGAYVVALPVDSQLTLSAYGQQHEYQFPSASTDLHQQTKGVDAQLNLPFGFEVGGDFVRDREDEADHLLPNNSFTSAIESWGVFVQETFRWKILTLIPGGRYDHNSIFGDTKNPRVQTLVDATPWLRFSGSAARSFRAPTIDDLFFKFSDPSDPFSTYNGNPNLKPESAWTYDGGFELHNDSESFKATYFRSNVKNLIQIDPVTFSTVYNLGSARREGVEFEFRQVLNELFAHHLNYTYLNNRGTQQNNDLVNLPYSPHNTVNYTSTFTPFRWLSLDNVFRFVSNRYAGYDNTGTKLGGAFIWDLRLAVSFRSSELYFGMADLTNKRYEESSGYPLPGRTFYGGVQCKFGIPNRA